MNYIVKNKHLFDSIYSYIDKEFEDLNYSDGYNYEEDKYTDLVKWFYLKRNDDDPIMEYVTKEWFEQEANEASKNRWIQYAPIVDFRGSDIFATMDKMFSHYWRQPFYKWFSDNFPQFPVNRYIN